MAQKWEKIVVGVELYDQPCATFKKFNLDV